MPAVTRWNKDATEFPVSLRVPISNDGAESLDCAVPKPIVKMPNRPAKLEFRIADKRIEVRGARDE